jgi:hypothetical protein
MVRIELSEREAALLRVVLEARLQDLPREIRHTHDREFREFLKGKLELLERIVGQLPAADEMPTR